MISRTVHRLLGAWVNMPNVSRFQPTFHSSQYEAIAAARRDLMAQGGGELTVMGLDGRIRSKDTIGPIKDPYPPRDQEH